MYLPGYSPDLNPIEEFFHAFKSDIRRNGVEYRRLVDTKDHIAVMNWLADTVDKVGSATTVGYFHHAGYL
jgi:transposase